MSSILIFEQILNGLQFGVMLFLMAAGLTLIFGVMGLINLAHGSLYMVGAFAAAAVAGATGSFFAGLVAALAAAALAGAIIEIGIIRRLYDAPHLDQVLATFALILIFSEGTRWVFGSFPLFLNIPQGLSGPVSLPGGIEYPLYRLFLILMGIAIAGGLWLLIERTRIGIQIRAGENDREMIAALGVDISKLYTLVFALGAALAGLAGALVGAIQSVQVGMGEPVLILAFVVIVIGWYRVDPWGFHRSTFGWSDRHAGRRVSARTVQAVYGFRRRTKKRIGYRIDGNLHPDGTCFDLASNWVVRSSRMKFEERYLNFFVLVGLLLLPIWAQAMDEPFTITLATRAVILALAAVGLNLALGIGGMVSFGHAVFFGIGGYAMGILAYHAQTYTTLSLGLFETGGTNSMPVIWAGCNASFRRRCFCHWSAFIANVWRVLYHDHARFWSDVLLFRNFVGAVRGRRRAIDLRAQRVSGPKHACSDRVLRHLFCSSLRNSRSIRPPSIFAVRIGV